MSNSLEQYNEWINDSRVDKETKDYLLSISSDSEKINELFLRPLAFGTAGQRGILRPGLNGMNVYTVRWTTQALANLILSEGPKAAKRGVSIACDSRHHSQEFAVNCAAVLAANGINSYIFESLRPTPELTFSILHLNCIAGINITASHNPKEYNGYKVYWEDGAQLPPEHADKITSILNSIDIFEDVKVIPYSEAVEKGFVTVIGSEIDEAYLEAVLSQSVYPQAVKEVADHFGVVYTPFHGSGYKLVPEVLKRLGLKTLYTVEEQMIPDGSFPTVKSPNPEDKDGFKIGIELAKANNIDLIIGTDPDADRVGIIVKDSEGNYQTLTGNQVGALLIDYLAKAKIENGVMPNNAAVVKSIVSTTMAEAIAKSYNITLFDVLTGFKFIGEKIKEFEETGNYTFLLGFEESYGYLTGSYARDKDAVVGAMLITEMACYYAKNKMSLYDAIQALYAKYGYYKESVISITIQGTDPQARMSEIMSELRKAPPQEFMGLKVTELRDYKNGTIADIATSNVSSTGLPKSDVLYFVLEDDSRVIVRPSGTEPKVKLYVMTKADSETNASEKASKLIASGKELIK